MLCPPPPPHTHTHTRTHFLFNLVPISEEKKAKVTICWPTRTHAALSKRHCLKQRNIFHSSVTPPTLTPRQKSYHCNQCNIPTRHCLSRFGQAWTHPPCTVRGGVSLSYTPRYKTGVGSWSDCIPLVTFTSHWRLAINPSDDTRASEVSLTLLKFKGLWSS